MISSTVRSADCFVPSDLTDIDFASDLVDFVDLPDGGFLPPV